MKLGAANLQQEQQDACLIYCIIGFCSLMQGDKAVLGCNSAKSCVCWHLFLQLPCRITSQLLMFKLSVHLCICITACGRCWPLVAKLTHPTGPASSSSNQAHMRSMLSKKRTRPSAAPATAVQMFAFDA
jgi:hypothetical protein